MNVIKKLLLGLFVFFVQINFSQEVKFGKVSKADLEEEFYPLDSTADAAYLFRKRRTYFKFNSAESSFDVVTDVHLRIKIYNKKGFKKATEYIYYYNPDAGKEEKISSLKGYTFNINKSKVEKSKLEKEHIYKEKKNKYWSIKKITMPNIKEGSVIDLKYKLTSPYYYKIDDLEFQFDIPVKELDYVVTIPEYYKFKRFSKGYFNVTPIISKESGQIIFTNKTRTRLGGSFGSVKTNFETNKVKHIKEVLTFSKKNIPSLKDNEPFVSAIDNYRGGLKFELSTTNFLRVGGGVKDYSNSWKQVSKQIFRSTSFGAELDKSTYYKKDVDNILITAKTNSEKIGSIFNFVKSKVKWNGYKSKYTDKGVRKAYKEREGNAAEINLMLTSMLRYSGLNANPVLVSTRNNGIPLFPTIEGFNYVISMVQFPDNSYVLLDATDLYSVPNMLPVRALNWNGRKVTKEGNSSWLKLTPSKYSLEENTVMVKVTEDLKVEGNIRTKFDKLNSYSYRKNNNLIKEEDLIVKYEGEYNLEVEKLNIKNQDKFSLPIFRTVKFSSEHLVEQINNKLYIEPLLFLTKRKNPFKLIDRKFPVDFISPWKDKNTISIQIPEGYKVETIPETMAIGLPDNLGIFKYQVKQIGNKIKAMSILQINKSVISPEYYQDLKGFYGELVKKQSEKIVLIKE